jgi:hypothetical protein
MSEITDYHDSSGDHLSFVMRFFLVDFDKIYIFYNKYCVCINKYVFIVVKIKCVNSDRICDICDKVNFTTKLHIFYNT